jgi:hypothetical protein
MPRQIIDYSKTMMYKIVSNDLNILDCYVASTTDFTKRKYRHKSNCANRLYCTMYNFKLYKFIRDNDDWCNWSMVLIEMYPCANHLECLQRERYWCEHLNATLNSMVPSRTKQEYNIDHKLQRKQYTFDHKEQKKQYREQHKEHIREQSKQYREQHKIKISKYKSAVLICECGCSYTINHKLRHELSKKHQEYEKNRLYYDIRSGLNIIKKLDKYFAK